MDHKMSRSPWVIHYDGSSCNGCDIEVLASLTPLFDAERFGVVNTGNPKHADIFLVTGSVNAQNLPVVRQIYNQMLEPKCVVACGICACSGGVFRDAYNVIGGVDRAIPVDVYAPGCAIRPETVIDAIVEACGILDQKEAVMRAGGDPLTVGRCRPPGTVASSWARTGLWPRGPATRPLGRLPRPSLQRRPSNARGNLYHRWDRRAPVACPGA